jgi:predicted  nucleic acid-binding Zn-ribbon protein
MFAIKDKEVRAIENNLSEARVEIKELKQKEHTLSLENEKLKVEKSLADKEISKLNKKIKRLETKLIDNI